MAKLDFPGSPTPSQKYPSPAVAGQPVYTWDGEKWTSIASTYIPGTAPFEPAMAYSGMQINGGMEVSQEIGTTGTTANATYACDGWVLIRNGTMVVTAAQAVASPNSYGFPNYLNITVATAQPSLGAGDFVQIFQSIEGYRCARLAWGTANAQPITVAFWSTHHRPGLYSGVIGNYAATRTYAFTYTHNVADVAQYNTITIPGETTGVWEIGNLAGMHVRFNMAMGSTYIAPTANTWLPANYAAAPGQINSVAATSDRFSITGVTVLPGTQAPTAAQSPNIMRPYGEELVTCQRYWQLVSTNARFFNSTANAASLAVTHPLSVEMRATPTTAVVAAGSAANVTGYTVVGQTTKELLVTMTTSAAISDSYVIGRTFSCDARL